MAHGTASVALSHPGPPQASCPSPALVEDCWQEASLRHALQLVRVATHLGLRGSSETGCS
jgi:hypothetical protein